MIELKIREKEITTTITFTTFPKAYSYLLKLYKEVKAFNLLNPESRYIEVQTILNEGR